MMKIRGHGFLTIGQKVIPFENMVNLNFLMAPMNLIDIQNMGGGVYESHGLMNNPCNSFQICSNVADGNLKKIFSRLAFVGIESFTAAINKPLKVVLRGGGQFHTAGVARSAGFNMVCGEGAVSGVLPYVNVPRRQARVRVTGIASLPFADNWVYHPTHKKLYRYAFNSSEVWALDFDMETGEFGTTATMLTDEFTTTGNSNSWWIVTDGVDKLFRMNSAQTTLYVCDLGNDGDVSTVSLLSSMPSGVQTGINNKGFDEHNYLIVLDRASGYATVDPLTGAVTGVDGARIAQNIYVIKEDYALQAKYVRYPYDTNNLAYSYNPAVTGTTGYFHEYIPVQYRFPDDDGWVVTATFDSATTPGSCSLYMAREPDMAYTMISIPPTEVDVDTPFSIEYTLEVVDNR